MLLDAPPGDIDAALNAPSPVPLPPAHVQVGDPTDMLRRRPTSAPPNARWPHATPRSAKAVAARFPKVSLFGLIGVSGTTLLDAERQQIAAQQSLSQAEAGLTTDYVSLQKALGLGWGAPAAPAAPHA